MPDRIESFRKFNGDYKTVRSGGFFFWKLS